VDSRLAHNVSQSALNRLQKQNTGRQTDDDLGKWCQPTDRRVS